MELGPAAWHLYPSMGLLVQTPTPLKAEVIVATSKWRFARQHPVSTAIFVVTCMATMVVLLDLVIVGNSPTTQPASVTISANTTAAPTPTAALRLDDAASRTGDPPSAQLREMLALILVILVGAGACLMHRRAQSATPIEIKVRDQQGSKPVCLTVVPAPL